MAISIETQRTDAELHALAQALLMSGGASPNWLRRELAPTPNYCPKATIDPHAYRGHMSIALSVGGLLVAFLCCVELVGDVQFAAAKTVARAVPINPDALEAIALVQDWFPAGDEKPVLERLAVSVRNPAYPRAWSAEQTADASYLVIFREPAGTPIYAFEVELESEAVQPTPEAVERLTMLRVREATETSDGLVAMTRNFR